MVFLDNKKLIPLSEISSKGESFQPVFEKEFFKGMYEKIEELTKASFDQKYASIHGIRILFLYLAELEG